MLAWWGSQVECASAVARLKRAGSLDAKSSAVALGRLKLLADGWREIEPSEIVRENAMRFLRVHPLRAADVLQLAAAFLAAPPRSRSSRSTPASLKAARKEGFELIDVIAD